MAYSYNRQRRQAAIGPTPANRAAQTMGLPIKLTQMAKKEFEAERPNKALDHLSTGLAHLDSALLELGIDSSNLRKTNYELRALSKSYKYDPDFKFGE